MELFTVFEEFKNEGKKFNFRNIAYFFLKEMKSQYREIKPQLEDYPKTNTIGKDKYHNEKLSRLPISKSLVFLLDISMAFNATPLHPRAMWE